MKNKFYKIGLLVLTTALMQSCFVAKEYHRPDLKTENLYRNELLSADTVSLARVSWNQIFTDPLLQEYIKKGLANNLDVKIALQNTLAAQAIMKQAKAGYYPTVVASADWTHQELSKNSQFGALLQNRSTDQYQLAATLAWEADIWGKIRSTKRATNATYLQSTAVNQAIKTQLIATIATTYYQLLSVDAQIKLAEKTLLNREQSIQTIVALKEAGNVTEVGVKQTEAQKYATEIIIADLKNSVIILENTLSILMGQNGAAIPRSTFENQLIQPAITLGVPALLLRNRPDVIAAEYNLISNFELTNVAQSNFYPTLKITASGGLQSIDLKEWFSANSIFANVITGLTQPIFNQRQNKTKYEIAKANQEKASILFQQALLTAGKEVSDALAQYKSETYKLTLREKQVDALNKATDYSDELLTYGLANYLEVLTVKDNALNAELNLIDTKFQQHKAIIQLYRSLGGGWQ